MSKPFSKTDSYVDREQARFDGDSLDKTSVRVVSGWSSNVALSYFANALYLEGFRYFTQDEDDNFIYTLYYNANDELISGYKVSKLTKRAEIYYPDLLTESSDRLTTEAGEGILL